MSSSDASTRSPSISAGSARPPSIDLTWRRYRILSARRPADRETALRLRYKIFQEELLGRPGGGIDEDRYDQDSEHLLIVDTQKDELVATCRFRCSRFTDDFYTAGEFAIAGFLARPGVKVEMGRACIEREHRNNLVIGALGQTIGAFARAVEARWFFGCSSVLTTDPHVVAGIGAWFGEQGHALPASEAAPRADHRLPGLDHHLPGALPLAEAAIAEILPPLLRGYLRAGARVSREPAFDPDFRCVDFFTALDLATSNSAFMGRYTATC